MTYDRNRTGLVVIDPYNDFISEGGEVSDRLKGVAEANMCVPDIGQVLDAARGVGIRVFYALHHDTAPATTRTGPTSRRFRRRRGHAETFEFGSCGGELRPEFEPRRGDVVAQSMVFQRFRQHDLDLRLDHGIHQLIVIGLIADACLGATSRYGAELGYEVTVVKDATAATRIERCMPRWRSTCRTTPPSGHRGGDGRYDLGARA